jgi:hypothetical protein
VSKAPAAAAHAFVERCGPDILRVAAVANSGGGLLGGLAARMAMGLEDINISVCAGVGRALAGGDAPRQGQHEPIRPDSSHPNLLLETAIKQRQYFSASTLVNPGKLAGAISIQHGTNIIFC